MVRPGNDGQRQPRATGGINGGNGGNVETSGQQDLAMSGSVDVSAPEGNGGTLSINAGLAVNTGSLIADGQNGGSISINAISIYNSGNLNARGEGGSGGGITLTATGNVDQASSASLNASGTGTGGTITITAGPGSVYDSATSVPPPAAPVARSRSSATAWRSPPPVSMPPVRTAAAPS